MLTPTKIQVLFLLVALLSLVSASTVPPVAHPKARANTPITVPAPKAGAGAGVHARPQIANGNVPARPLPNGPARRVNRRAQMSNAERLRLGLPLKKPVFGIDWTKF